MTRRADVARLLEVVERVRLQDFDDLDTELVASVLEAQIEHSENQQKAIQESERVLRQWLAHRQEGNNS